MTPHDLLSHKAIALGTVTAAYTAYVLASDPLPLSTGWTVAAAVCWTLVGCYGARLMIGVVDRLQAWMSRRIREHLTED